MANNWLFESKRFQSWSGFYKAWFEIHYGIWISVESLIKRVNDEVVAKL